MVPQRVATVGRLAADPPSEPASVHPACAQVAAGYCSRYSNERDPSTTSSTGSRFMYG
jgi:hypothetical protein